MRSTRRKTPSSPGESPHQDNSLYIVKKMKSKVNHTYLIFVTNAVNAVRVKFLAECKKIPEKRESYCFGLRLYHNSDHVNVLFYTKCAILHRNQCFILHLVFDFTLGV